MFGIGIGIGATYKTREGEFIMKQGNESNREDKGGRIGSFEDLVAWQESRVLTREIYSITSKGPLKQDFGLRDQVRRASVSVMSNIAEGFERIGAGEKVQFMNIARASCAEVKSLLYVCLDNEYLEVACVNGLQSRCTHISRLTSGLIRSVSKKRKESNLESESESESGLNTDSDHS